MPRKLYFYCLNSHGWNIPKKLYLPTLKLSWTCCQALWTKGRHAPKHWKLKMDFEEFHFCFIEGDLLHHCGDFTTVWETVPVGKKIPFKKQNAKAKEYTHWQIESGKVNVLFSQNIAGGTSSMKCTIAKLALKMAITNKSWKWNKATLGTAQEAG